MFNNVYKETILPSNPALKPFDSPKDCSSFFVCEREPKELPAIFVLDQEEVFSSIISLLEFEQILGYTPEGSW